LLVQRYVRTGFPYIKLWQQAAVSRDLRYAEVGTGKLPPLDDDALILNDETSNAAISPGRYVHQFFFLAEINLLATGARYTLTSM
jgi:hypothetical protein